VILPTLMGTFRNLLAVAALAGCNPEVPDAPKKEPHVEVVSAPAVEAVRSGTGEQVADQTEMASKSEAISVAPGDFAKLVAFIEKNGFVVEERGVKSDHQYTFFDKQGNRHALITIKRDESDQPSLTGTVDQISVWAYKDGIKDQEHFFGYYINNEEIAPFSLPYGETNWKEKNDVKAAYDELCKKVGI
jgi:hypothetical protein